MDALGAKTAHAFERLGVRFAIAPAGEIRVAGPANRADVLAALREEVSRRSGLLGPMLGKGQRPQLQAPRAGTCGACDTCGDPLPRFRGGMCPLCALGITGALRARGPRP